MRRSFPLQPSRSQHKASQPNVRCLRDRADATRDSCGSPLTAASYRGVMCWPLIGRVVSCEVAMVRRGGGEGAMRIPFDTDAPVSRRTLLKGAASTAALAALPASLVGCGGDDG